MSDIQAKQVQSEKIKTPATLLKLKEDQELSIQDAQDLLNLVAAYVRQNILPKANKIILESATQIKIIDLNGDEISFVGKKFIKPYQEKIQEAENNYQEAEKYSKELYDKKQALRLLDELGAQGDRDDEGIVLAFKQLQKTREEVERAKSEMEKILKSRSVFVPVDGQNTAYSFVQKSIDLIKKQTPDFDEIDFLEKFNFLSEGITQKDILTSLPITETIKKTEEEKTESIPEPKTKPEQQKEKQEIAETEKVKKSSISAHPDSSTSSELKASRRVGDRESENETNVEPENKSKVVSWVKSKVKKLGEKGKEIAKEELEDFKQKHLEDNLDDSTTKRIIKGVTKEVLPSSDNVSAESVETELLAN